MTDTLDIVPLKDLKVHLRVYAVDGVGEDSFDIAQDEELTAMLETARGYVEGWCGPLDDFDDAVPAVLAHAMKLYAGHLFMNREATAESSIAPVPLGFFDLIDPYRLRVC